MHGIIANTDRIQMPFSGKKTVIDAINYVIKQYPEITIDKESSFIAVNHEIAPLIKVLQANDIVSLLPPIGGG